jgi:hypothetical protein
MRSKPFTFKKTKRIKQVVHHPAISVDLTVQEAADLYVVLAHVAGADDVASTVMNELFLPLLDAIEDFLLNNPAAPRILASTAFIRARK